MSNRSTMVVSTAVTLVVILIACDATSPMAVRDAPLDAVPMLRAQSPQAVPLKGSTRGMVVGLHPYGSPGWTAKGCPGAPYAVVYEYLGYGNATHLGRFSIHGSECVNMETLQSAKGEFTLTAANGDELEFRYDSGVAVPQPPFPPTEFEWSADGLWCDGGTGRFASAACEGAWGGGLNMATGQTWSTIDAKLTYSASDRRNGGR